MSVNKHYIYPMGGGSGGGGGSITPPMAQGYYSDIKKLANYAYECNYDALNYDYAEKNIGTADVHIGLCSAVRNGAFFGRNLDWLYNNKASFVVHTSANSGRYSTVCICGQTGELTEEFVSSGAPSKDYLLVPFMATDGMNEHGLVMEVNVVPTDKGQNETISPTGTVEKRVCLTMLVRYVLDNFSNVDDAITYLQTHVELYHSPKMLAMGYNMHFLIADETTTKVIEFVEGAMVIREANYMTNFHLDEVTPNANGTVYTPETMDADHDAIRTNGIEEHGSGLERYNLIATAYNSLTTKAAVVNLMKALRYTNAYLDATNPFWYTEFTGNGLTVVSPVADFADIVADAKQAYAERSRDHEVTWQTVHTVIYDFSSRTVYCYFQEENTEYTIEFKDDREIGDYRLLTSKPKVNNVELVGNKTLEDLGITRIVNTGFVLQHDILIPNIDAQDVSSLVTAFIHGEHIMVGDSTKLYAIEYAESYSTAYMLGLHVGINDITYTADYDPVGGVYVLNVSIIKPAERVMVISSREEVVDGFTVPVLTTAQVARLYQGLVDGHSCVVSNSEGDVQFKIAMGDGSSGRGSILLQYYWLGMVDYQIAANNTVAITVHKESIPAYEITDVTITDNTIDITIA